MFWLALVASAFMVGHLINYLNERDRQREQR